MQPDDPQDSRRAALSALMDGRDDAADAGCRAWRSEEGARADWHAYHLIGDVLRSDEHHADAAHDARFVARLRERLAAEPAVLAPVVRPLRTRRTALWMAPAAVAAGFVAVAGVLVVTRVSLPGGEGRDLSAAAAAAPGVRTVSTQPVPASAVLAPDNVAMIRSAELDRYLEAHRAANASALVAPGGVVRSATVAAPGR